MDVDLDQLRELMKAMDAHGMTELELEQGQDRIVLRRGGSSEAVYATSGPMSYGPPFAMPPASAPTMPQEAASQNQAEEEVGEFITSPFVGTFYRSPNPNAPPFVKEGGDFESGKPLCIVEAMKLMNEIESEFAGTVLEVLVENGKPVEYGDRLFRVRRR